MMAMQTLQIKIQIIMYKIKQIKDKGIKRKQTTSIVVMKIIKEKRKDKIDKEI